MHGFWLSIRIIAIKKVRNYGKTQYTSKTLLKMVGGRDASSPGTILQSPSLNMGNFQPKDGGEEGQRQAQSHVSKSIDFIISVKRNKYNARHCIVCPGLRLTQPVFYAD